MADKKVRPQAQQASNFNFSDLVHEHDTFTDTDGAVYEFLDKMDFGAVELAKAERWQRKLPSLAGRLRKNSEDEAAAQEMETISAKMVGLILPGLPEERIEAWTLRQRTAVLEFWSAQQKAKDPASGGAQDGDKAGEVAADQAGS